MNTDKYKWKTVKFDDLGAGALNANFEGLIGIEECSNYNVVSKKKGRKSRPEVIEPSTKRKAKISESNDAVTPKKHKKKEEGDFQVESISPKVSFSPSLTNFVKTTVNKKVTSINNATTSKAVPKKSKTIESSTENKINTKKEILKDSKVQGKNDNGKGKFQNGKDTPGKKQNGFDKAKDGPKKKNKSNKHHTKSVLHKEAVPMEEMGAWSSFGIPEVIMKNLAEQGFRQPTSIQELTLPAAMHGRRDILGAAETGSGKTLAFGIPILNGILQLKEKAANGDDDSFVVSNPKKTTPTTENYMHKKIVNINKLPEEERKILLKRAKRTKKKKSKFDDFLEQDSDSEDDEDPEEDESESEAEGSSDGEAIEDDDDNDENVDVEDNEDLGFESEGTDSGVSEDESVDDPEKDEKMEVDDNEDSQSDFEEREEDTAGVNEDGIGCVKVIDNIGSSGAAEILLPRRNLKPLYALILTPTRELAIQVKDHLVDAAKNTDIRVAVVVGGMAQVKQERILKHGPEIVVATPGRLWEMIQQGNDHLSQVADIRFLGIDETDRMVERGHFEELHHLLDRINDNEDKKARRQNFVFSATLTMVHELPKHLSRRKITKKGKVLKRVNKHTSDEKLKQLIDMLGITNPKIVDVTTDNQGASNTLTECRISCPIDHKDYYLYYVLNRHPGRTIIFCNSIGCVKRLAQLLTLLQCNPLPLHASMQQRQRLKNLDRFRDNPLGLLVATDVAARGLDIPNVEHVIHYQVPRTAENYVHRSGRTARASKEGIAILIMEPGEAPNYLRLCRTLNKTEDLPHFPVPDALLSSTKQRVALARELDLIELRTRKTNSEVGWYEKAMKEMDIVIDKYDMPRKVEKEEAADLQNVLAIKKKQLNALLAKPIFPKGFSFKFPTNSATLEQAMNLGTSQNAIQAMKSALESGLVKKLKKQTKNEAVLKLESSNSIILQKSEQSNPVLSDSTVENVLKDVTVVAVKKPKFTGIKVNKNKWKKLNRNSQELTTQ